MNDNKLNICKFIGNIIGNFSLKDIYFVYQSFLLRLKDLYSEPICFLTRLLDISKTVMLKCTYVYTHMNIYARVCICVCLCVKEVSDIPRWLQTLYIIKGNLEFPIFPPSSDWDYVYTTKPCFLETEPHTVCS